MKRIISYNVNGLRAAVGKGLLSWLATARPDVLCLQETKATEDQVDTGEFKKLGYHTFFFSAEKKGYSGVAIFSQEKPLHVEYGTGNRANDREGRIIRADFRDFSVASVYVPSGSSGDERQSFKMEWLHWFQSYIKKLRSVKPDLILAGDFNICHKPIDIHNPVANARSSGFLPEERDWMEKFLNSGWMDGFRHFNREPHQYTWWSFRGNARARNLGWRIDYQLVSGDLQGSLKRSVLLPDARHSDHCPVVLEIEL